MIDAASSCTFTTTCPLPTGSGDHLTGCPGATLRSRPAPAHELPAEEGMGVESEYPMPPLAFWIGLGVGLVLACMAILVGFALAFV